NPRISAHNLHHNASDTAEVALALLFAAAKEVVPLDQHLREGDWGGRHGGEGSFSFEGKTALILGYGQIGQRSAKVLLGLGMEVRAVRRQISETVQQDGVAIHPSADLHKL